MADIRNAYLQSPTSQKYDIICRPEFGIENVSQSGYHAQLTGQSMVEKQVEEISETNLDHASNSSVLVAVQLILMFV